MGGCKWDNGKEEGMNYEETMIVSGHTIFQYVYSFCFFIYVIFVMVLSSFYKLYVKNLYQVFIKLF